MLFRIPRVKIFKDQDPRQIEVLYAEWVDSRMALLKEHLKDSVASSEDQDILGIPSQLQLQWFQGLQAFMLCVNYNAHPLEVEQELE